MRILEMQASFGRLNQAVLRPEPGLNVIFLPNEGGKSTWQAFLLAMFYGIDTTQRASKGVLPDKSKYQPWNGAPMEGAVTLEWEGRVITMQRTSRRGRPMADFRAWDKNTGLDLPELTGENCGKILLGVERSVFQRTACLSGDQLTVTKDDSLAKRLENLAAAGSETDSYPKAETRLKLWKNHIHYNQNGLLPEAQLRLRQTRGTIEAVEKLRRRRLEAVEALAGCRGRVEAMEQAQRAKWQAARDNAAADLADANSRAEALTAQTYDLPTESELQTLLLRLEEENTPAGQEAPCPPALEGIDADALLPKAQRDTAAYEELISVRRYETRLPLILTGILSIAGITALLLHLGWMFAAAFFGIAVLFVGLWARNQRQNRLADERAKEAQAILDQYGVKFKEDIWPAAVSRRDDLLAWERASALAWESELLLERVRTFEPDVSTAEEARQAIRHGLDLHRQVAEAQQQAAQAALQWTALPKSWSPGEALQDLRLEAASLEAEVKALQDREQALGDWDGLWTKAQHLEAEIQNLTQRERAISLAQEALASANGQLAQVYAPRLTGLAGEYLGKLTLGRYDGLILQGDFSLLAREKATGLARPMAVLSRGTQDQAWLALRLAMTALLLPPDTPILLDDVFLTFDQARRDRALEVLREENRQILLFTCREL